jgi:hypothetical protein
LNQLRQLVEYICLRGALVENVFKIELVSFGVILTLQILRVKQSMFITSPGTLKSKLVREFALSILSALSSSGSVSKYGLTLQ